MELEDESQERVALLREFVVGQTRHGLSADGKVSGVGLVEQSQDVQQRTLAAPRRPDDGVRVAAFQCQ